MKKWKIINPIPPRSTPEVITACLLFNRGLKEDSAIEDFFHPNLDKMTVASVSIDQAQLDLAVKRIKQAIEKRELIIVYTDYDVDGICAGAIVWQALHHLGAQIMPYVPDRVHEGYGLSRKGIDNCYQKYPDAKLIITVDHGITAAAQVEYAKSLGLDVIVTDHHLPPQKIPTPYALVHTTDLAGSGVAWMLVREIVGQEKSQEYLDLVALATIADLVPLVGFNRTLVFHGLQRLNSTSTIGLRALIDDAALAFGTIGTYEVGHVLAPRINAMGRLTHGLDALRLLCTKSGDRARELAQKLSLTNRERQLLTQETVTHAQMSVKAMLAEAVGKKLLFIHHETYNQGIIGLVAGKLVEQYYRPAVVISRGEVYSKASARSVAGFNIIEAIRSAGDLLVDCGGHPMAAGFTVLTAKLPLVQEKLEKIVQASLSDDKLTRTLRLDCQLDLDDIDWPLMQKLRQFEPFGIGNPEPAFVAYGVTIADMRVVGKEGKHLKLALQGSTARFNAIAFGLGELYGELLHNKTIDIAYSLDENIWNGNRSLQLHIKDIQLANKGKN